VTQLHKEKNFSGTHKEYVEQGRVTYIGLCSVCIASLEYK